MEVKKKIAAAIISGSLIAGAILPVAAFADQTCTIRNNGNNSTNRCRIKVERRVTVDQRNTATVRTRVIVVQNTGLNDANNNTTNGGDVTVDTGNTTSTITITVSGNTNTAVPPDPGP
ncbi:MAG: hypothetical protein A2629_00295 [Candidatus Levybacteria bacterium RIFCSPHIGHO2_01_FULL_41_15]|nr:MAG: hypothetical protein A2629_00295 [Candidatus Levybacteria bacterium RIFCSPHIGHO2_01_FULL_41_15]